MTALARGWIDGENALTVAGRAQIGRMLERFDQVSNNGGQVSAPNVRITSAGLAELERIFAALRTALASGSCCVLAVSALDAMAPSGAVA